MDVYSGRFSGLEAKFICSFKLAANLESTGIMRMGQCTSCQRVNVEKGSRGGRRNIYVEIFLDWRINSYAVSN